MAGLRPIPFEPMRLFDSGLTLFDLAHYLNIVAPVAQLDRAPPSEGGGHTFESCRVRHLLRWQPILPRNMSQCGDVADSRVDPAMCHFQNLVRKRGGVDGPDRITAPLIAAFDPRSSQPERIATTLTDESALATAMTGDNNTRNTG